ncbi:MAG: RNA polymerase sigma factor [Planctomycetaceae bacterium]|jgi:RNA polymerase sigma factor (sigma-70 family)|nr:RNA polymerase sigma factor [Planctomycetaceae bacterium]
MNTQNIAIFNRVRYNSDSEKILGKSHRFNRLIFMEADFRQTWDETSRGLILYARQWVGTAAEDVVQDAFLKLLTESPPTSAKAWLYRVVRNNSIDLKRRQRWFREPPLENWFESLPEESVNEPAFDGEELTKALESLPTEIREVIVSKIWGGLNFREIAELTNRSTSSVHRDYQQGIEQLKKELDAGF